MKLKSDSDLLFELQTLNDLFIQARAHHADIPIRLIYKAVIMDETLYNLRKDDHDHIHSVR